MEPQTFSRKEGTFFVGVALSLVISAAFLGDWHGNDRGYKKGQIDGRYTADWEARYKESKDAEKAVPAKEDPKVTVSQEIIFLLTLEPNAYDTSTVFGKCFSNSNVTPKFFYEKINQLIAGGIVLVNDKGKLRTAAEVK